MVLALDYQIQWRGCTFLHQWVQQQLWLCMSMYDKSIQQWTAELCMHELSEHGAQLRERQLAPCACVADLVNG